tara:strand:+ start:4782 stop:5069 length:288 start_codon:yes stop_codon:yes gene_type:complete
MITLKGKDYNFRFGFKAMMAYEEATGSSMSAIGEAFKMGTLVDLCYHGIVSTGDTITRETIIDAIDEKPALLTTLNEKLSKDMSSFNAIEKEAKK